MANTLKNDELESYRNMLEGLRSRLRGDLEQMTDFAERLKALNCELVIIDPVYLCINGVVDHANLFQMGDAFRIVAEIL